MRFVFLFQIDFGQNRKNKKLKDIIQKKINKKEEIRFANSLSLQQKKILLISRRFQFSTTIEHTHTQPRTTFIPSLSFSN